MTLNQQSHNILQRGVHIMLLCSVHLCLHNKSEHAHTKWPIKKACQKKESILTVTLKIKIVVQVLNFYTRAPSHLFRLTVAILLPLKQMVTLLMTSGESKHNVIHWCIALFSSGKCAA